MNINDERINAQAAYYGAMRSLLHVIRWHKAGKAEKKAARRLAKKLIKATRDVVKDL
nr:MAG TPA: hypothetical protein [Caudoviricetes sp.]